MDIWHIFLEKYLDLVALILSVLERLKGAFISLSVHKIVCPLTGCENRSLDYQYVTLITNCLYMLCVGQLKNVMSINGSAPSLDGFT